MAWAAVDKNGMEVLHAYEPYRGSIGWIENFGDYLELPKGSIAKLIGRELTWDDEPVELVETNPQDKEI